MEITPDQFPDDDGSLQLKIAERAAIDYFKEKLTFNNYHYGTKKYIVTNGIKTYSVWNILDFNPKEGEVVFEIRMKAKIVSRLIPCIKKIERRRKIL